jgi:hypothetical protein
MFTTTRCQPSWPRTYTTYFQELEAPFRRADRVRVLRLGRTGLVFGRWTSKAEDEYQAVADALQIREIDPLDDQGNILPIFLRDKA